MASAWGGSAGESRDDEFDVADDDDELGLIDVGNLRGRNGEQSGAQGG